ncbi:MAG TPA: polysaccharide pyruvyl transferase family protein [Candidatus Saccharimonadales bacterium]|nr:polysaccharide pyruvyl transferase family protein [Candidatus Saccharimonadales bacterium]
MRVLISNVYSYKNKGDAAIVISLLQEVRRVFTDADIMIQTTDLTNDKDKYGAPITGTLLWIMLSSVRDRSFVARLFHLLKEWSTLQLYLAAYRLFGKKFTWLLSAALREFVRENEQADLVIACGGGYLRTAKGTAQDTILLSVTCLNFLAAKTLGKKVYLYSQSIGPVHGKLQQWILRRALNKVDLIEPREDVSMAYLKTLNLATPIVMTADPALLLGGNGTFPERAVQLREGRLHVGLTVRKWFKDEADLDAYVQAVATTIDYLIEKHNAEAFYIPQVIAENFGDDDRLIAERVQQYVKNKQYFTLIDADLHPFEVIGVCGSMDIFIGTRMHSNIFSLISHVPVVAIEYEHKTKGIMRGLKLEPLTIDIRDVTAESLRERVDLLLADRAHFKQLIEQNLPSQMKESRKAIEVISSIHG